MDRPKIGIAFPPAQTLRDLCDLARMAEDLGFDAVGLSDSQSLYRDVHIACGALAGATESILIGSSVTNPVTRHAAVTAGTVATLNELSGGRSFVGIASGDSSVLNLGLSPMKLREFEEYLRTLRSLLRTGTAVAHGRTLNSPWMEGARAEAGGRVPPVWVAAEGPKTLQMAARTADGVLVGMGLLPKVVEASQQYLAEGARASGRDVSDLDVWWLAKGNIGSDFESCIDEMRMALAASAHHAFRFTLAGKQVPEHLADPIRQLQRRYRPAEHEVPTGNHNADLVDSFGLKEYLAARFAIAGSASDWIDRIQELRDLGVSNLWLTVHVRDKANFLREVGTKVLPHVR